MASNPIQRKQTTAFLTGALITLIITGLIIAFLAYQLLNAKKAEEKQVEAKSSVYVLNKDVKSGDEIDLSAFKQVEIETAAIPANAIGVSTLGNKNICKIDLKAGTLVTADMLYIDTTPTQNDTRKEEYNMISLPLDLETGDYIDIRFYLPNGQNFIVLSKKVVTVPVLGSSLSEDTIQMNLNEDEILTLSCAIVEAWKIKGSKLYANRYTEPGIQEAATPTYTMNADTVALIRDDPNVLQNAKDALAARYKTEQREKINTELNKQSDQVDANEQTGMDESITKSQDARKEYLDSLTAGTTTY